MLLSLQHISHPNITPLLAHLSTATHHILVLPYLPGGDLLGLVNNDIAWGKLSTLRALKCRGSFLLIGFFSQLSRC